MFHDGKRGCSTNETITMTATQAIRWAAITAGEVSSDVGLVVLCVSIPWTTSEMACRRKLAVSAIFSFRLM
jgi:hypothetical protein